MRGIFLSPIGPLYAVTCGDTVLELRLLAEIPPSAEMLPGTHPLAEQLTQYFSGKLKNFHLPIAPRGTDFQQKVWSELRRITYGQTVSYGEIATRICGSKNYSRAVAGAARKNPILLLTPCHRMIGTDGALTGFNAGLPAKRYLLELERSFS